MRSSPRGISSGMISQFTLAMLIAKEQGIPWYWRVPAALFVVLVDNGEPVGKVV